MIIEMKHITKYYGDQCVIDDLSFSLNEPKIIALVAPNGTGKTTLLNIICNIEQADEGEIVILNKSNTDVAIFKEVTYLQDYTILYEELTGQNHIEFIASIHQISQRDVKKLTDRLGITSFLKKQVGHYSLGMKQRLLFAMAILPNPKVIILDEPLNGLDPDSVLLVRNILKELHESGSTILFSSHNLSEIDKLTTDIYFLSEGDLLPINKVLPEFREYIFVLSHIEKVIDYGKKQTIYYERLADKKISLRLSEDTLYKFLTFCSENQIEIYDQYLNSDSTENLYFDLYRGENDGPI